jgi:hypothetical protein
MICCRLRAAFGRRSVTDRLTENLLPAESAPRSVRLTFLPRLARLTALKADLRSLTLSVAVFPAAIVNVLVP